MNTATGTAPAMPVQMEEEPAASVSLARRIGTFLARQYLAGVLLVLVALLSVFQPAIIGAGNINSVLLQAAITGVSACGMALLIGTGLLDLSVPGVIAISALTAAALLPNTTIGVAIAGALAVGALAGLINGVLVAYLKIASFIATLGTQYLFLGIAFIVTEGGIVPIESYYYRSMATQSLGPIPVSFLVLLVVAGLAYGLLYWTHFGRGLRAIGSNERAARLAGVPVSAFKAAAFVIAGVSFAGAGVFLSGLLSSASGTMALSFELNAIAAVVVGGTALRGGRATLAGTVVGAVLFSYLSNALNLLGVASYWQYVLTGTVLAVAVAAGSLRRGPEARGAD
ncbi:ABC transporter permease [Demequina sp. NBRC 110052]|uniref:ABC transporter permease n=1 Tax=Demequina sp. NBRC 110052 TaxID=1570341 RepID=UPI000A00CFA4|nr:ABC transporter permease [Demequina sp. NBRC 110052]